MTVHLLDSSVWIAARRENERHHVAARRLVANEGARTLAALDLTLYEVANVAIRSWGSARSARLLADLVRTACPNSIVHVDTAMIDRAITLAADHGLSVYDAAYVAAAELNGWTLVSGDHADLVGPGFAITAEEALAAS